MTESFKRNFGLGLLAVSILSLTCFGLLGIGRPSDAPLNFDGGVLYAGGRAWLMGLNPYQHDMLVQSVAAVQEINLQVAGFFYPPQSAAFFIPLGLFDYSVAKYIWLALNLLSIAAIVFMTVRTINEHQNSSGDRLGSWVLAAMIIGCPFTTHVVWMGQTALIAFACTMAAWFFSQRQKFVWAGIFLALASLKPQMCLLLGIWFLLERNWKILAAASATTIAMSAYPLVFYGGPVETLTAWIQGINEIYHILPFNQPGFYDKVGMESLLASVGVKVPAIKFLAVILTVVLWVFRNKVNRDDIFALLVGISFTFLGYTHAYDYVGLFPILASLWVYSSHKRKDLFVSMALVFLLFFPRRVFLALGWNFLVHWRTIVVAILVAGVLAFSMRAKSTEGLQQEMA